MVSHPLDRAVWSCLTTRQRHLALGDDRALRLHPAYGIFAATADDSPGSLAALARLNPPEGGLALLQVGTPRLPEGIGVRRTAAGVQMVAPALRGGGAARAPVESLGEADASAMLELARLTEPGPFFERTHQLGDFVGVKQDGRLVAMAGERMKPEGFTEVSGVCTHPDHRGRGYAGTLMRVVADRILARGETPFLHAYADNASAIALYESLGFTFRTGVTMTLLDGNSGPMADAAPGR